MTGPTGRGATLPPRWQTVLGANVRAKIIAGVVLLLIWQFGVAAFAPPFVAKPVGAVDR